MSAKRRRHEGIEVRHKRACRSREGGRCNCSPSYRVVAWSAADGKKLTKTFSNLDEAKGWRHRIQVRLGEGTLRAPTADTVQTAADALIAGMRDGSIRNRKGEPYKPSAVRSYERALRLRILPALGSRKLSSVRRADVQGFIDGLMATGLDGSTIRNTLDPLRVIFRRAIRAGAPGGGAASAREPGARRRLRHRPGFAGVPWRGSMMIEPGSAPKGSAPKESPVFARTA